MTFFLMFFFFQAEDGIRDVAVTGVQTCALPISHSSAVSRSRVRRTVEASTAAQSLRWARATASRTSAGTPGRSAEAVTSDMSTTWISAVVDQRDDLDAGVVVLDLGQLPGQGDHLVQVGGLEQVEAAEDLLAFQERSVGHRRSAVRARAQCRGR